MCVDVLPGNIRGSFERFNILDTYEMENTLPSGRMMLDTSTWTVTFIGELPAGAYYVVYGFIDAQQCPVGTLTVWISTVGGERPEVTPTPEPEEACVRISSFCAPQQRISLLTLLTGLTEFSTQMTVDNMRYSTEFAYCGEEGSWFTVCAPRVVYAEDQSQRVFQYWASYDEGQRRWNAFSESTCVRVEIEEGTWIAAFYQCETTSSGTPTPPSSQEVCVRVSAFYQAAAGATTTTPKPGIAQYLGPVPFQTTFTINDRQKLSAESSHCGQPGQSFKICTHQQVWTTDEQQLIFSFWAKYDEQRQTWTQISDSMCLQITLREGGWLAAFYDLVSPQTENY
jgi:hypothetical protein